MSPSNKAVNSIDCHHTSSALLALDGVNIIMFCWGPWAMSRIQATEFRDAPPETYKQYPLAASHRRAY